MSHAPDRLYELLPVVYRLRDADQGYPLRALLEVIAEQVEVVEDDVSQLYENWFIETCQDWVVPYIGSLIGYRPLFTPGEPTRLMTSRSEVANTIRYRRRKGTLSLLSDLAEAVAGWPARAVEFYRLLSVTQHVNYVHLDRGRTAELRDADALDDLGTAFDDMAHTLDVRRSNSRHSHGRANVPDLGVFVWRLKSYTVTSAPAYLYEEQSPSCYLFSALGNDTRLYTNPINGRPSDPPDLKLPVPIRRRGFEVRETSEPKEQTTSGVPFYYGDRRSLEIWTGTPRVAIAASQIVATDLSDWSYRPLPDHVAVDPELGRLVFPPGQPGRQTVWVSYSYGFSADLGGGEYDRPVIQPADAIIYQVGEGAPSARIGDALALWQADRPPNAVIEITDSRVYAEPLNIQLAAQQTLQLRAANRRRPVIRLLDWQTSLPNSLGVTGSGSDAWFVLDGLIVTGRGVRVEGQLSGVIIRHSTLVPGWGLNCDCEPKRPMEPSLELVEAPLCVTIEHSIVGAIQVQRDEVREDPVRIHISDSVVDATSSERIALGATEKLCAYAVVRILRSTVIGQLQAEAIELAENSILLGLVKVCRRQQGCMRFCYVPPGSRTPRRYECQPDLVEKAANDLLIKGDITAAQRDALVFTERLRVEPEFNSTRYGRPTYCQLAEACAPEITQGSDDESELGVFHDLYQPQRRANLRARLDEFTPAGVNAGVIFAS